MDELSAPKQARRRVSTSFEGAALMIFTCACFAAMSALIRDMSDVFSPFQIAFFRNAVGLLVLLPIMARVGFGPLKPSRFKIFAIRGIVGITAMWCWYTALALTPLAEAITLNFTVALWMIPVAILLLGERVGRRRWTATLVGFAGVLVVLQPGTTTIGTGGLLAIGAALLFAVSMALIRMLARTESPLAIVFYMNLMMTPVSLVPALLFWTTPAPDQLVWLIAVGLVATLAHFSMARALTIAEATALVPLDFTRLPFAAAIGYFAFGEVPGLWTWVGAAIIIASAVYISRREIRRKKDPGQTAGIDG